MNSLEEYVSEAASILADQNAEKAQREGVVATALARDWHRDDRFSQGNTFDVVWGSKVYTVTVTEAK